MKDTSARTGKTLEDCVREFRATHGDRYDYSKARYLNARTKLQIGCSVHGEFWQTSQNHRRGSRCPKCSLLRKWSGTLKERCKEEGVDYWRALKRRHAGMSEEMALLDGYVRSERKTHLAIAVFGNTYPNLEAACRALRPVATSYTISRWLRSGITPEAAFERIPNPGYRNGIIYSATHVASDRQYVGLTITLLADRWRSHLEQAAANHIKGADSLHAAIRRYGAAAFSVVEIDRGTTKQDLERKEREWIARLNSMAPAGFNLSAGGESGGSCPKPYVVDGVGFPSIKAAILHVADSRKISLHAAKARIRAGRVDVKAPPKKGQGNSHTPAYKAWSRIVHGVLNARSKSYESGMAMHEPWRDFRQFLQDVGQPGTGGMILSRLNQEKGFFPDNCAWLSKSEFSKRNACHMRKKRTLRGP